MEQHNYVEPKEVIDYLRSINALHACEACKNQVWSVLVEPIKGFEPSLIFTPASSKLGPAAIPISVLMVVCTKCGHIRQHMKMGFDQWKASQKTNDEAQG